jgi:hypothetical protein
MLNYFRRQRPSHQHAQSAHTPEVFNRLFLSRDHHQWITQDKTLLRGIQAFLDALTPTDRLSLIKRKRQLLLVPASGRFSCAFNGSEEYEFILIFPDLVDILRSAAPERGVAVLLHEAGHLVRGHSHRSLNAIEAQLEADLFCVNRGYGEYLYDFLLDQEQNREIDLRLRFLESNLV